MKVSVLKVLSPVLLFLILVCCGCGPSIRHSIADEETVTGSDWSAKDLKDVSDYMADSIKKGAYRNRRNILLRNHDGYWRDNSRMKQTSTSIHARSWRESGRD